MSTVDLHARPTVAAPRSATAPDAPEEPTVANPEGDALDQLLEHARAGLERLGPREAADAIGAGALLIDIRPEAQRRREGEIPGAVIIERNVLEWRLAPGSPQRIPELADPDQVVIVTCSAGYASSLAAASLQQVGLPNATDLDGGFLAWDAAGLPVAPFGYRGQVDRTRPRGDR
jgi:rhodanese-related sulfurtransferase